MAIGRISRWITTQYASLAIVCSKQRNADGPPPTRAAYYGLEPLEARCLLSGSAGYTFNLDSTANVECYAYSDAWIAGVGNDPGPDEDNLGYLSSSADSYANCEDAYGDDYTSDSTTSANMTIAGNQLYMHGIAAAIDSGGDGMAGANTHGGAWVGENKGTHDYLSGFTLTYPASISIVGTFNVSNDPNGGDCWGDFNISSTSSPSDGLPGCTYGYGGPWGVDNVNNTVQLGPGSYFVEADCSAGGDAVDGSLGVNCSETFDFTVTINPDKTVTTLTSSPDHSVFGQPVTFTATVTPSASGTSGASALAGESVYFFDGSTLIGSGTMDNTGTATFTTDSSDSVLPVGTDAITAEYEGDTNFAGSTSNVISQTVQQDGTATTVVASSGNPSVFGQAVTFTATVTADVPGGGTPQGTVDFINGSTVLGSIDLDDAGVTSFTTKTGNFGLPVGTDSITAVYDGDENFITSTSDVFQQTVKQDGTTTTVESSNKESVYGMAVTFTASVTANAPGGGTPAGTVQFVCDMENLGDPVNLVEGSATSPSISNLPAGDYTIDAEYLNSDSNFLDSSSGNTVTQTVDRAPLTISADEQTKPYGEDLPDLTASYIGFVNGDSEDNLATEPTLSTTATAKSHVSGNPYTISVWGAVDKNYNISYVPSILTVTPVDLTITAGDKTKAYGAALPALTASFKGFVNGDTVASLAALPALTTTATAQSHVSGNPYSITASVAIDFDYNINYVSGSLTITPVPLSIKADNKTKVYGAANPTLTATYTGLVNGDTAASVPVTLSTAAAKSGVGTYAITASGATDSDYTVTYANGTLTITKAPLTITADNKSKVYGQPNPTLTATYTGLASWDTASTAPVTLTTTAAATSGVGAYAITPHASANANYTITCVNGTLSITKAPLTITADDKSKVYGAPNPTLTATYAGLVNGDTAAKVPVTLTTAATTSGVGTYAITARATSADYTITCVNGTLTITAAPLTITAVNKTKVYGAANPALTATYVGLINGDSAAKVPVTLGTVPANSGVGAYDIIVSGASNANYTITCVNGTLTITPAALTVTAGNKSKAYGAANPTLTATYIGLVNGDVPSSVTVTLSTVAASCGVGSYAITVGSAANPNYAVHYVNGTLTVTKASLTVTANGQIKVYGDPNPTLMASYAGLVNGDTAANVPVMLGTVAATSGVGAYTITANGATNPNYTVHYVIGTLTITPAALTITADDKSKVHGKPNPALTATYAGLVNGDTAARVPATLKTTATTASLPGTYPITVFASNKNYTITLVNGNLTIS